MFEAALDLPEEILKVGVYDTVPSNRSDLLAHTRDFIADQLGGSVLFFPRADFPDLIGELTATMFDH